jgi:hypothetical protein
VPIVQEKWKSLGSYFILKKKWKKSRLQPPQGKPRLPNSDVVGKKRGVGGHLGKLVAASMLAAPIHQKEPFSAPPPPWFPLVPAATTSPHPSRARPPPSCCVRGCSKLQCVLHVPPSSATAVVCHHFCVVIPYRPPPRKICCQFTAPQGVALSSPNSSHTPWRQKVERSLASVD